MTPDHTQTTALTPNSNCTASGAGDASNSTLIQFMSPPNQLICWSPVVSNVTRTVVLSKDNCCEPDFVPCTDSFLVTFKKGLTITYEPSGGDAYYVFLSGEIVDAGQTYTFPSVVIYVSTGVETDKTPTKEA